MLDYLRRKLRFRNELDGLKVCLAYLIAAEMKRSGQKSIPDDLMDITKISGVTPHTWIFSFFGNNHPVPDELLDRRAISHRDKYPGKYELSASLWEGAFASAMSVFDMVDWFLKHDEPPPPKHALKWGIYWNKGRYFPKRWLDQDRQ